MIIPFIWMVLTSLKPNAELFSFPPTLFPSEWRWENYVEAMQAAPFHYYFRNSLIIAVTHTLATIIFGTMAGYALARIRFRGRETLFMLLLSKIMVPTYVIIVPQFLIIKFMPLFGGNDWLGQGGSGWLDTWFALLIPGAISPFAIFLFRQFYIGLPKELEDAARIDGCSEYRIFYQIMTPLIKPAIAAMAIFQFQTSWNNFLWPLLVTTKEELRVIQIGLTVFQQEFSTQWAYLMAGTTLAIIPMIIIFIIGQKYFVQGLTSSGLKG